MYTARIFPAALLAAAAWTSGAHAQAPAPTFHVITNSFTNEQLAQSKFFLPEGAGPFPCIVVMHGSGGLWRNDDPVAGIMSTHFEEFATLFQESGYASLFIDSYTVRGLTTFSSRRPHEDPAIDDALCSHRLVRPGDAYSALAWLQARPEIDGDRVGLMGFSQGGESTLATVVDPSILLHKPTWTVNRNLIMGGSEPRNENPPHTTGLDDGFKALVAYYPGCGFFGYFGSSSSTASKLYMPYAPTLVMHGDGDGLYADNLYPLALRGKSQSHADFLGLPVQNYPIAGSTPGNNPLYHILYTGVGHSFDELTSGSPGFAEKEASRVATMAWFDHYLAPQTTSLTDWIVLD